MSLLKISNFIKKIISIILIVSVSLFSPVYSSASVVPVTVAITVLIYALKTPAGKAILKKIGKQLFGTEDYEITNNGDVVFIIRGDTCFWHNDESIKSNDVSAVARTACQTLNSGADDLKIKFNYSYVGATFKHPTATHYVYDCVGYNQVVVVCPEEKREKVDKDEILREIKKHADLGDANAKEVIRILSDDNDDDDDDSSRNGSNKNKGGGDDDDDDGGNICKSNSRLKADDPSCDDDDDDDGGNICKYNPALKSDDPDCKKKDDDDDNTCKYNSALKADDPKCKKDDDNQDDIDVKCNSSEFHKKVCDFIDWTYDETDKAKKKIDDFFDDDEALSNEKRDLKDLVEEKDVENKKSSFDLADACPAPKSVTSSFLGRTVTIEVFNFTAICKWADFIAFGLNLTAMIVAINIIAGRKMD